MSKTLVAFGATGQQGGSIVDFVLNDPELSKAYTVRGITRDPASASAQKLQGRGVEVVAGDVDKPDSLPAALANAHTVFIVTNSIYDDQIKQRELRQVKAVADAAMAAGAQYLIFSTCVAAERLYGRPVPGFDSKAEVEAYLRTLPIKSAFFAPGMFMQNFLSYSAPQPVPGQDGTYAIANVIAPDARHPLIDTVGDSGKYVGAILADPDKYVGKVLHASTGLYTYRQVAEIITRVTGKNTIYAQIPKETWAGYMPPGTAEALTAMMEFIEEPGYYGPETEALVAETAQQARGKLTTFEEFVEKHKAELFP